MVGDCGNVNVMNYDPNQLRFPRLQDLYYQFQPIEGLDAATPGWHEALVRWRLPDGTVRGPLDVLPYWLSPNRSEAFTRFTVARAAKALLDAPGARISINLSPTQVTLPAALEALRNLQPELQARLVVELTEQRIRNLDAYMRGLESIRAHTGLVLLDDVSFDDLDHRFRSGAPIDGIKLDRSLLPALLGGTFHQRAIDVLESARDHFDIVVAEGVEDPTVRSRLFELGVTHVQGFGIGMPAEGIPVPQTEHERVEGHEPRERPAPPTRLGRSAGE